MKGNPSYGEYNYGEYNYSGELLNGSMTSRGTQDPQVNYSSDPAYNRLQRDSNRSVNHSTVASNTHAELRTGDLPLVKCSAYATPLVGLSHTHTPESKDVAPTPYLTPSVQSINPRRAPPHSVLPPQYEEVSDAHIAQLATPEPTRRVTPCPRRGPIYDVVAPYTTTQNSEISLISETEV